MASPHDDDEGVVASTVPLYPPMLRICCDGSWHPDKCEMACGCQGMYYYDWQNADDGMDVLPLGFADGGAFASGELLFEALHRMRGTFSATFAEWFAIANAIDKARRRILEVKPAQRILSVKIYSDADTVINVLNDNVTHMTQQTVRLACFVEVLVARLKEECKVQEVSFSWRPRETPMMVRAHDLSQRAHLQAPALQDGGIYRLFMREQAD